MQHNEGFCSLSMDIALDVIMDVALAASYYFGLVLLVRLSGKRHVGQIAAVDLLVLIALGVVLQNALLRQGVLSAAIFFFTVFFLHQAFSYLTSRYAVFRTLLRHAPRAVVKHGKILSNLKKEGLNLRELKAGLRKKGIKDVADVAFAVLEENGELSIIQKKVREYEYDIYFPLSFNDGVPVPPLHLKKLKTQLLTFFGGVTDFKHKNEGLWKVRGTVFRDEVVVLRVLADQSHQTTNFFLNLKKELKTALDQDEILIIERKVKKV